MLLWFNLSKFMEEGVRGTHVCDIPRVYIPLQLYLPTNTAILKDYDPTSVLPSQRASLECHIFQICYHFFFKHFIIHHSDANIWVYSILAASVSLLYPNKSKYFKRNQRSKSLIFHAFSPPQMILKKTSVSVFPVVKWGWLCL